MHEIEIKFLEVDVEDVEQKLKTLGAIKQFDQVFEEWVFQKPQWREKSGRIRLRKTSNITQLCYKETIQDTSKGNLEVEVEVDDAANMLAILDKLDLGRSRRQQKRRIEYKLNNVLVDIDFWPLIPPYVEIEGDSYEDMAKVAKLLEFDMEQACQLDAFQVYDKIYNIDIRKIDNLTF